MIDLILALLIAGQATYYAPGVMDEVFENRLAWGHVQPCELCVGMVALLDREMVGELVYLQRPGYEVEGPFLVIDCAAAGDRANLVRRGWAVDVDWATAQRWGMRKPVPVKVWMPNVAGCCSADKFILGDDLDAGRTRD